MGEEFGGPRVDWGSFCAVFAVERTGRFGIRAPDHVRSGLEGGLRGPRVEPEDDDWWGLGHPRLDRGFC